MLKITGIAAVGFASLISLKDYAATSKDCHSAEAVLRKFLALEASGETTHTSSQIDALIYYNGRDIAGWDAFNVISSSKIKSCKVSKSGLRFDVRYEILGLITGNEATQQKLNSVLSSKPKIVTETFSLVRGNKGWQIDSPSVPRPHVEAISAKHLVKGP